MYQSNVFKNQHLLNKNLIIFITLLQFILFTQLLTTTNALPTTTVTTNTTTTTTTVTRQTKDPLSDYPEHVIDYLVKYGYLVEKRLNKLNEKATNQTKYTAYSKGELLASLIDFQSFMSLKTTGVLDKQTMNKIHQKRCGVPDKTARDDYHVKVVLTESGKRKKRDLSAFHTNKKSSFNNKGETKLYWNINPKPDFKSSHRGNLWHTMEYALNRWASVADLVFLRGDFINYSDILIGFWKGKHGDNNDFDGPGGTLGHADVSKRTVHLDDEENWSEKSNEMFWWIHPASGTDLIQAAIHEIGHVLGLSHDNTTGSVMKPTMENFAPLSNYVLIQNDIDRVKASYGRCEPDSITGIFSNKLLDGRTYILKGPFMYQMNDGHPVQTEQSWPRAITLQFIVDTFVDEAFWHTDSYLYFFDAERYSIYDVHHDVSSVRAGPFLIDRNPRMQNEYGWRGLRHYKYIDAALVMNWGGKQTPFLFQDEWVYKYDLADPHWNRPLVPNDQTAAGWPKKIVDVFPGLPGRIDTAFTWAFDGKTYFFKGRYFYIWDGSRAKGLYATWQWQNICNIHLCMIAPRPNFYNCESWEYNKKNCNVSC